MKTLQNKDPQISGLAAEIDGGQNEIEQLPKRVDRYAKAKARSRKMQEFLKSIPGYEADYLKLKQCGNWLMFHFYYTISKVRLHNACLCRKHLLCPLCAILRASKYMRAYVERFKFIKSEKSHLKASMVTLTIKNGSRLNERFNHLKNAYKKLEDRRRQDIKRGVCNSEWSKVHGLVGTYEFTNKGKGWHAHMHILILHEETLYTGLLAKQWRQITKDSNIVDITSLYHPETPEKDFLEVFKYALKFGEMSLEDNLTAFTVLTGKRLIFSAGLFRGVKIPENWMDDEIDTDDLPYIEILYRYQDNSGYNLISSQKSDKQITDLRQFQRN